MRVGMGQGVAGILSGFEGAERLFSRPFNALSAQFDVCRGSFIDLIATVLSPGPEVTKRLTAPSSGCKRTTLGHHEPTSDHRLDRCKATSPTPSSRATFTSPTY
jgi:hypothetical protein